MNDGAETFTTTLSRTPGTSWGFRLQGGADFATPLSVQLVNPGSIAEQFGVRAGDAVLQINGRNTDTLDHDRAKEEIMRAGDSVTFLLQRGQVKIWKPQVTNLSELKPTGGPNLNVEGVGEDPYAQRTSLAADKQQVHHIGSAHNRAARPFMSGDIAGPPSGYAPSHDNGKGLVHAQYNSPMNMYSGDNVASTYDAHAQQLPDAVARVVISDVTDNNNDDVKEQSAENRTHVTLQVTNSNGRSRLTPSPTFGKRYGSSENVAERLTPSPTFGKRYGSSENVAGRVIPSPILGERRSPSPAFPSPTLIAIMAEEGGVSTKDTPKTGLEEEQTAGQTTVHYKGYSNPHKQSRSFRLLQDGLDASDSEADGVKADAPSDGTPLPSGMRSVRAPVNKPPSERQQAQHMTCKQCGSLIVGVFVRIQGEPIHPDCFKCCRCGKNLKNQGHFIVDKQMYCEAHASSAAQSQAPGPDMVAMPVYR